MDLELIYFSDGRLCRHRATHKLVPRFVGITRLICLNLSSIYVELVFIYSRNIECTCVDVEVGLLFTVSALTVLQLFKKIITFLLLCQICRNVSILLQSNNTNRVVSIFLIIYKDLLLVRRFFWTIGFSSHHFWLFILVCKMLCLTGIRWLFLSDDHEAIAILDHTLGTLR